MAANIYFSAVELNPRGLKVRIVNMGSRDMVPFCTFSISSHSVQHSSFFYSFFTPLSLFELFLGVTG